MKNKTKSEISVTINQDVVNMVDENFDNRSKFVEYCIIQELIKNDVYREKINKITI
jgi:metal-responsive CopG/Arc/MetJ family transcriptional regulator